MFDKVAVRKNTFPKIAFMGVSGAGKTYSALRFARGYVGEKGRIAFLDTENGSSSIYSDLTEFYPADIKPVRTSTGNNEFIEMFRVEDFINGIIEAVKQNFDILVIDSASQVWQAVLDLKNRIDANGGNQYTNWKKPKELMAKAKKAMLNSPIPIINCFRSKIEYVMEKNENGQNVPKRIGMAPIATADAEYDYTLFFDVDREHKSSVIKSRSPLFGTDFNEMMTEEHGANFRKWIIS